MTVAIGFVLLSVGLVAFGFVGSETRSGEYTMPPMWAIRMGKLIAFVGGIFQLLISGIFLGTVTGPILVCVAWMVAGFSFAAFINAWPYRTLRCAWFLGLVGLLFVLFGH